MNLEVAEAAIEFFKQRQLHGVVRLIEFLLSPQGTNILKIGSTTIGMQDLDKSKYKTEEERAAAVWSLGTMHFGRLDGKRTALEDLVGLATEQFDRLSKAGTERFDMLCSDLHLLATGSQNFKLIGSGMVFGRGGEGSVQ